MGTRTTVSRLACIDETYNKYSGCEWIQHSMAMQALHAHNAACQGEVNTDPAVDVCLFEDGVTFETSFFYARREGILTRDCWERNYTVSPAVIPQR